MVLMEFKKRTINNVGTMAFNVQKNKTMVYC